jgi:reactive intermediate/imine deaminase
MQAIDTNKAPAVIGSYSQAIHAGNMVYLSGQIGLDATTMLLVSDEVKPQIKQTFENIKQICIAAGGNLSNIAKLTVYVTDIASSVVVNEAMDTYFTTPYPARALIQVSALPRNAKVEMDAIMVMPNNAL